MSLTFSPASFDYHFSTHNKERAALEVSVAGPKKTTHFWYDWYVTPGSTFDTAAASKLYVNGDGEIIRSSDRTDNYKLSTVYGTKTGGYTNTSAYSIDYGLRPGNAVATVGVRTVSVFDDTIVKFAWSTRHVVADPCILLGKTYISNGFTVLIPPLKNAQSYTVYLGKRKSANSSEVTGWKAVGTFAVKSGKTTKAVVDNYGGKKFKWVHGPDYAKWAVKGITNTRYGSSPGDYWLGYKPDTPLVHEGMIY